MSYYGYGQRRALEAVDYSAISKSFIDFINKERTTREEKRKEIQENFDKSLTTLADTPQGTHAGTTNFVLNYTEQAQAILLDANRRLRSGELRLRDYNTITNNLNRDTEILFGQAERLQADYATFEEKLKTGEAGAGDLVTREILEKFSRMDDHRAMINPTTGEAMIGALVPIDPNKPYNPTSNPYSNRISDKKDAMMFIGQLNSASSVTHAAFNEDEFNKDIDGIQTNSFSIFDKDGHLVSSDKISPQGEVAVRDFAKAALTDPWKLYDYAVNNGLTEGYTLNGADESKISFISDPNNPNGGGFAIDTQSQAYKDLEEKAINHLTNKGLARFKTDFKLVETKGAIRSRNLRDASTRQAISKGRDKKVEDNKNAGLLVENLTTFYTSNDLEEKRDAATDIFNQTGIRLETSPDGTMSMFEATESGGFQGGVIQPQSLEELIESFDASQKVTVNLAPFISENAGQVTFIPVPGFNDNITALIATVQPKEVTVDVATQIMDMLKGPDRAELVRWADSNLNEKSRAMLPDDHTEEDIVRQVITTEDGLEAAARAFGITDKITTTEKGVSKTAGGGGMTQFNEK